MKTSGIMLATMAALVPGVIVSSWQFGIGVPVNILVAVTTAVAVEVCALKLTGHEIGGLKDGSAILTGLLLALCLPPYLPVWMIILGTAFALIFGKHLYGGLGHNLFNPAMVGYAVLIVSFPLAMSQWQPPAKVATNVTDSTERPDSITTVIKAKLTMDMGRAAYDGKTIDGRTMATPLDAYKFRTAQTNDEFFVDEQQSNWQAWCYINLAYLLGGLYLVTRKIVPWQAPASMLAMLGLLALIFYDAGSSASLGSPVFHLLSGATMLAAFFIITDPVTCPGLAPGLLVFGASVGLIVYIIRSIGAYPDGVAFAVLLMNACVPLIDHVLIRSRQQIQ